MHTFRLPAVLCAAVAAAVLAAVPASAAPPEDGWIVVLKDGADARAVASEHRARHRADVDHVYTTALRGYAGRIPGEQLGALRADRRVAYVEKDGEVRASATQTAAPWGLDRIDQRGLPLSGTFTSSSTGAGVTAYVVDTGIRASHADFGGRVTSGYDAIDGGATDDCNGHGTHVAGTVAGATHGVAKGARLVGVRVLDCAGSGSWSGVIAGVDWVTRNHVKPAVANMSLGGGASTSVDTAVKNSIAAGVGYAVAAGNGNQGGVAQDACKSSPARLPEALTVGATDRTDRRTSWSNYGACVDLFAPGNGITSAWHTGDGATNTISGTSMASPHVAGAAALHLERNPSATPAQVRDALHAATTKDVVTSAKSANDHLLYTAP